MDNSSHLNDAHFLYCSTELFHENAGPCILLRVLVPLIYTYFLHNLVRSYRISAQPKQRIERFTDERHTVRTHSQRRRHASLKWRMCVAVNGALLDSLGFFYGYRFSSIAGKLTIFLYLMKTMSLIEAFIIQFKAGSTKKRRNDYVAKRDLRMNVIRVVLFIANISPFVWYYVDESQYRFLNAIRIMHTMFGCTCAISMISNCYLRGRVVITAIRYFATRTPFGRSLRDSGLKDASVTRNSSTNFEEKLKKVKNRLKQYLTLFTIEAYFVFLALVAALAGSKETMYVPFITTIFAHLAGVLLGVLVTLLERKDIQRTVVREMQNSSPSTLSTAAGTSVLKTIKSRSVLHTCRAEVSVAPVE